MFQENVANVAHFSKIETAIEVQRHIQNPTKQLRWSILQK